MRHFIVIFLALAGCITDDELAEDLTAELVRTDTTTSPDDSGTVECPPVPPTPPPHVLGDVTVAEPEELISDADWLEALSAPDPSIASRH